jgi:hypothetical protein
VLLSQALHGLSSLWSTWLWLEVEVEVHQAAIEVTQEVVVLVAY